MIKESSKSAFELVIVWKLDRFARNLYNSAHYKAVLQKIGVKVISATEKISQTPEGILLESLLEGMAEYYSAELAEKVTRGLTENALKCKYNGGTLPIGYAIDENQFFVIDPLTAPAPNSKNPNLVPIGSGFGFLLYLDYPNFGEYFICFLFFTVDYSVILRILRQPQHV